MWKNEAPFAQRLWDFDLKYILQINRQAVATPLAIVQPIPISDENFDPQMASFKLTTTASHLFIESDKKGQVEKYPYFLKSCFDPE